MMSTAARMATLANMPAGTPGARTMSARIGRPASAPGSRPTSGGARAEAGRQGQRGQPGRDQEGPGGGAQVTRPARRRRSARARPGPARPAGRATRARRHQPEVAVVLTVLGLLGDQALGGCDQGQVAEAEQGAPEGDLGQGPGQPEQQEGGGQDQTPAASMPNGRRRSAARPSGTATTSGITAKAADEPDHGLVRPQYRGPVGGDRPPEVAAWVSTSATRIRPSQPGTARPPGSRRRPRQRAAVATTMPSSSLYRCASGSKRTLPKETGTSTSPAPALALLRGWSRAP